MHCTRRHFLHSTLAAATSTALALSAPSSPLLAQQPGQRPKRSPTVEVLGPRAQVPVSLIIDDSTCLVNLAHFAIPQFAEVFPDQYRQDWRKLPREIPDAFVRKFALWCADHGVKGKYSVVPYPACVGWVDRDLPGWTKRELTASLNLVRDLLVPHWDIHPEMITHTWGIDTKTGRPYPDRTEKNMENWGFSAGRSVDFLADYLAYALRVLKNAGLHCEGVTTPGGFGNRVLPELAQASLQACRDVHSVEIPHYFRHLYTGPESVAPRVEYAASLDTGHPECVVSIIGCTGDWFGGWDGLEIGHVDQFIGPDLKSGRLPQVIARGEPAVLVCHWPGMYCNGDETGFKIFQEVVARLKRGFPSLLWMKLSEIARYWAAKELTTLSLEPDGLKLDAPFAAPQFTLRLDRTSAPPTNPRRLAKDSPPLPLKQVPSAEQLVPGTWCTDASHWTACFDLPRGRSTLAWS